MNDKKIILATGMLRAEQLARRLRKRLAQRLQSAYNVVPLDTLVAIARDILEQFEPILAQMLSDVEVASWVVGVTGSVNKLPGSIIQQVGIFYPTGPTIFTPIAVPPEVYQQPPVLRFPRVDNAVKDLTTRNIITRETFDELSDEFKRQAFTIAKEQSLQTIDKIRNVLVEDIAVGTSLGGFRERLGESLQSSFIGPAHIENVYRTNALTAYANGQETIHQNPIVQEVFPYAAYFAIHDSRARPEHRALETHGLNGTNIYRADDPMWQFFTPPWDFQCRCSKTYLTLRQAAAKGITEAQQWLQTGEPPEFPEWRLHTIPFREPESGYVGGVKLGLRKPYAIAPREGVRLGNRYFAPGEIVPRSQAEVDQEVRRFGSDVRKFLAVAHAPKGGVTVEGEFFPGGRFIPGVTQQEVNAAASSQHDTENVPDDEMDASLKYAERKAYSNQVSGDIRRWERINSDTIEEWDAKYEKSKAALEAVRNKVDRAYKKWHKKYSAASDEEMKALQAIGDYMESEMPDKTKALNEQLTEVGKEISKTHREHQGKPQHEIDAILKPLHDRHQKIMDAIQPFHDKQDELMKAAGVACRKASEIRHTMREEVLKPLDLPQKQQMKLRWKSDKLNRPNEALPVSSATLRSNIDAAVNLLKTKVTSRYLKDQGVVRDVNFGQLNEDRKQRAFYYRGEIYLSKRDVERTVWHEMGHDLQSHPAVMRACTGFLLKRTTGEEVQQLSEVFPGHGYEPTEFGMKDEFGKAMKAVFGEGYDSYAYYAGKYYSEHRQTEILSLGLEALYENPAVFAQADPEWFDFTVAALHGMLFDPGNLSEEYYK